MWILRTYTAFWILQRLQFPIAKGIFPIWDSYAFDFFFSIFPAYCLIALEIKINQKLIFSISFLISVIGEIMQYLGIYKKTIKIVSFGVFDATNVYDPYDILAYLLGCFSCYLLYTNFSQETT